MAQRKSGFLNQCCRVLVTLLAVLTAMVSPAHAAPGALVVDDANMLSTQTRAWLEETLSNTRAGLGTDVAVATVDSLRGVDITVAAKRIAQGMHLGDTNGGNSVLLLIVFKDRLTRIQTSQSTASVIVDAKAKEILRESLTPALRHKAYDAGVAATVTKILASLRETRRPQGE